SWRSRTTCPRRSWSTWKPVATSSSAIPPGRGASGRRSRSAWTRRPGRSSPWPTPAARCTPRRA
ncbi:MAG: hypothetical protein AVDCRST_MAG21-1354, partial [uncultured Nocardioidaceae bacterium]